MTGKNSPTLLKSLLRKIFSSRQKESLPVGLPAHQRIYCVGDIHGRLDLLQELQQKINHDAKAYEGSKTLVYLGDYIDRGMHSKQVVDNLLEDNFPDFKKVFLLGNHEQILLQFLLSKDVSIAHDWFRFGGLSTLVSYGINVSGVPTSKDLERLRNELTDKLPASHVSFFQRLELNYEIGGYYFVHAGIRPKVKLQRQRPEDLLWIREEFLTSNLFHGKIIVHGHSVTEEPEILHNRIALDTGAYTSGRLTCAVFEGVSCSIL